MSILVLLTLFIIFGATYCIWNNYYVSKTEPPAPFKLPIIGNLHQVAAASSIPWIAMNKLSQKYGPIMSLQTGMVDVVILADYEDIKYLFNSDKLTDRSCEGAALNRNMGQNLGLIWASGNVLKTIRKFSLHTLGDFGLGKSTLEGPIRKELEETVSLLKDMIVKSNGVIHIHELFCLPYFNIIWNLVAGVRYSYDDPRICKLVHLSNTWMDSVHLGTNPAEAFPFLNKLFPELTGWNVQTECSKELHQFMRETIKEQRRREGRLINPESFIDVFLNQVDTEASNPNSLFTDDQLVITLLDMFQAGTDTLNGFTSFAVLYMMLFPNVQEKVQAEIDAFYPREALPTLDNKLRMVYTQATILEIFRLSNVGPLIQRKPPKDFYYKGFHFKTSNMVLGNFYSVHSDKIFWDDPSEFRPERFIAADGSLIESKADRVIIYGYGKRRCLGMSLAQHSLFIFFAGLLHKFTFKKVPGQPNPTTQGRIGIAVSPFPFDCVVECRE